jgi:hypothetical protein
MLPLAAHRATEYDVDLSRRAAARPLIHAPGCPIGGNGVSFIYIHYTTWGETIGTIGRVLNALNARLTGRVRVAGATDTSWITPPANSGPVRQSPQTCAEMG